MSDDTITVPRATLRSWRDVIGDSFYSHGEAARRVCSEIDALLNPPPPKRDWGVDLWGECSRHDEDGLKQRTADFAIDWLRSQGVVFPEDRGTNRGGLAPLGESTAAPQAAAPVERCTCGYPTLGGKCDCGRLQRALAQPQMVADATLGPPESVEPSTEQLVARLTSLKAQPTESVEAMVERWRATAPWSISSAELNGALMFERWRRENQR